MARIRTIKPEFFTSEDIVSMPPLARMFYVALWCESDREGRLEWKPGTFKMRYLPGDSCDVTEVAEHLISRGLVVLYEANGKQYAEIPTFKEHQVINNREAESVLPPREVDACARVEVASTRVKAEGKERKEGKGKEGVPPLDASASPSRKQKLPSDFQPDATGIAKAANAGVSLEAELQKFRDYHAAKGSVMLDWQAAFRTWIGNAVQFGRITKPVQQMTVPGPSGPDPALAKLDADAKVVRTPTPAERAALQSLKTMYPGKLQ